MTNKIVAIQGDHPSKLNINSDTSVFLANEVQSKRYKIFGNTKKQKLLR